MSKLVIFNDTLGVYGGSQTLMLRMCQWLRKHDHNVLFLCDRDDNKEIVPQIMDCGGKVVKVGGNRIKNLVEAIRPLLGQDILMISFSWNFYMEAEAVKKKLKTKFHNIIYCIIPSTFEKGAGINNEYIRKIMVKPYVGLFRRMLENNAVVMMDEVCLERSERWLKIRMQPSPKMLRLPISFPDNIDKISSIRNGYESNVLLTASRADFPMKGYLMSLIDDFCELKKICPDAVLKIIAAGHNENRLKDKIDCVPEHIKKDILLIAWIPYDELLKELERCKVFIGMGSTLLDAAKLCKICIPVRSYTEENQANSFFEDDPRYLCAADDCRKPALSLIIESMQWDFKEYQKHCLAHYEAVKHLYDEDVIMNDLISITTKNDGCILSQFEINRHKLNLIRNRIKNRGKIAFDYNTLSKKNGVDGDKS